MKLTKVDRLVKLGFGAPTMSLGSFIGPYAHLEINLQDSVVMPGRRLIESVTPRRSFRIP